MQLENAAEEEEAGKDTVQSKGSAVAKTDKLRWMMEGGKEGENRSSDSFSKVMISAHWS